MSLTKPSLLRHLQIIADQPWSASRRRQALGGYLHAKLEADDGELAQEGCHGFWELSINKENHADIRIDRWGPTRCAGCRDGACACAC